MAGPPHSARLPRWLFRLTASLSATLIVLVTVAPLLDPGREPAEGWRQLVALFARDATLRRTAVASAIGLLATAGVFFRADETRQPIRNEPRQSRPSPPPQGMTGA